jgi:predicted porin
MTKYSLGALVAAGLLVGGLTAGSASAADLGGDCCADLEERIAELEATTARKGNRKVSLTISGWVGEQVMWWDDGAEQNVYVGGLGTTLASHFKLTGEANIAPGWSAGYVIHVEVFSAEPFTWSQDFTGTSGGVGTLQSFWFLKSDTLGKVSVGKQSHATDNTAILVDGSGSLVPANWVLFDNASFFLRDKASGALTGITWGDLGFCQLIGAGIGGDCNGVPLNVVRYDSPTFGGFSVSASWGEDDMWDVAARYAGEFGGFKVAVAAGYAENTGELTVAPVPGGGERDVAYFQIGGYVQHVATGLFVYGAYGEEFNDNIDIDPQGNGNGGENYDEGEHWYLKAGLRERWSPLGHTVLYGEYAQYNDTLNPLLKDILDVTGNTEIELIGGGVVQEIDAAAMSLWITYRHYEAEIDGQGEFEDFDLVKAGALINF